MYGDMTIEYAHIWQSILKGPDSDAPGFESQRTRFSTNPSNPYPNPSPSPNPNPNPGPTWRHDSILLAIYKSVKDRIKEAMESRVETKTVIWIELTSP